MKKISKLLLFCFVVVFLTVPNLSWARRYKIYTTFRQGYGSEYTRSCRTTEGGGTSCRCSRFDAEDSDFTEPPGCEEDFFQYHIATPRGGGFIAIPEDYNKVTSDPWVVGIATELIPLTAQRFYGGRMYFSGNSLGVKFGYSWGNWEQPYNLIMSLVDQDNRKIISSNPVRANYLGAGSGCSQTYSTLGFAYRICAEYDPCERPSVIKRCAEFPVNDCFQKKPGKCVVDNNNNPVCIYELKEGRCNNDGDPCHIGACQSVDGGVTAFCEAGKVNMCGGVLPCGRGVDNPNTAIDETQACTLCHFAALANNTMDYIMKVAAVFAVLCLIVFGILLMLSGANVEKRGFAIGGIKMTLVGLVIIFVAWLVVDFILSALGFKNPLGGSWNVVCVWQALAEVLNNKFNNMLY